ncbi:hypothetical protein EP7_000204 [Isosphaeraceae bacterium EP7]
MSVMVFIAPAADGDWTLAVDGAPGIAGPPFQRMVDNGTAFFT